MTAGGSLSLGLRTASYGSLQQQSIHNNNNGCYAKSCSSSVIARKPSSKMLISGSREREKVLPFFCCRLLGRRKVAMLLLFLLALLVFTLGSLIVNKESNSPNIQQRIIERIGHGVPRNGESVNSLPIKGTLNGRISPKEDSAKGGHENSAQPTPRLLLPPPNPALITPSNHPCKNFALPPPPPPGNKRIGPRPCPVCYLPVEQAIASMPSFHSESPVLRYLTYVNDENPEKPNESEPHGGSDFGGYPSLKQRSDSFEITESMTVYCGFCKGSKPGRQTGFDIDEVDLMELEKPYPVIVASGIFGNYDVVQQPKNIHEYTKKTVPFFMFIDEETEAYLKKSNVLDDSKRIGLWRIIVIRNLPYTDPRLNGKIPKLLLHRICPHIGYSIWIDGKLELLVDPYQILERFLWSQKASFAISRHYTRFDVFEEAEANKAAGKYENASIDRQIQFYYGEGLTPYSPAKLPITSDVPEGCVLIRENILIVNLFFCNWFNEVWRFTARDQLSFSTVRDKIMAKVDWNVSMFLDCERRNFVSQTYHRELLEHMAPPIGSMILPPPLPPTLSGDKTPGKRIPPRRGRGSSRRHRKVIAGIKGNN
ncbi:DUF616 domain-containing protein [Cephalotus follicularis]|uniref:DUF616 domain-containing protein n=1 Tax=Cephalotus follicularis TaxID=3775 RepID=A0A1Q3D7S0_CEPFO|nr:DUF616 domain-containing protein [Cephalotus follicularis]